VVKETATHQVHVSLRNTVVIVFFIISGAVFVVREMNTIKADIAGAKAGRYTSVDAEVYHNGQLRALQKLHPDIDYPSPMDVIIKMNQVKGR